MTKQNVIKLLTSSTVTLYLAFAIRLVVVKFQFFPATPGSPHAVDVTSLPYVAATVFFIAALVRNPIEFYLKREKFTVAEDWAIGYLTTAIVAASYDGGNLIQGLVMIGLAAFPISVLMLYMLNTPNLFQM
jgi:hypothetical protein